MQHITTGVRIGEGWAKFSWNPVCVSGTEGHWRKGGCHSNTFHLWEKTFTFNFPQMLSLVFSPSLPVLPGSTQDDVTLSEVRTGNLVENWIILHQYYFSGTALGTWKQQQGLSWMKHLWNNGCDSQINKLRNRQKRNTTFCKPLPLLDCTSGVYIEKKPPWKPKQRNDANHRY